jgi:hypothetical protein
VSGFRKKKVSGVRFQVSAPKLSGFKVPGSGFKAWGMGQGEWGKGLKIQVKN